MTDTLVLAAAALRRDAEALRLTAENVANAGAVGYRRQLPVAHAAFADLLSEAGAVNSALAGIPVLSTAIDHSPGALRETGEPLHLALTGPGYFVVETADGPALTRNGDWRLDAAGRVVTTAGEPVLGTRGPLETGGEPVTIGADGTVRLGDTEVDRLALVLPADVRALTPAGTGRFRLAPDAVLDDAGAVTVRQGALETGNVVPVNELTRLLEMTRHAETTQRLVRAYDGLLDRAISELGKV